MNKPYNSTDEISGASVQNNTNLLTDRELIPSDELFTMAQPASIEKPETEYAGLGKRMGAYLVDMFIVVSLIILLNLILSSGNPANQNPIYHKFIVPLIIWILYYGLFESSIFQATPGKMLYRLKVTDNSGNRIGFIRSSMRFLSSFLSILPIGLGIWDIEANPCFQGWHDKLLGCYVILNPPVDIKVISRINSTTLINLSSK
jgi:uncharacterized RDD family membrane protein YckC